MKGQVASIGFFVLFRYPFTAGMFNNTEFRSLACINVATVAVLYTLLHVLNARFSMKKKLIGFFSTRRLTSDRRYNL